MRNKTLVFQLGESSFSIETFQEQSLHETLQTPEQSQTLERSLNGREEIKDRLFYHPLSIFKDL